MNIETEQMAYRKKKPKNKPWKLEARYTKDCWLKRFCGGDWFIYSSYATEKARDEALKRFIKSPPCRGFGGMEFRKCQLG